MKAELIQYYCECKAINAYTPAYVDRLRKWLADERKLRAEAEDTARVLQRTAAHLAGLKNGTTIPRYDLTPEQIQTPDGPYMLASDVIAYLNGLTESKEW